MSDPYGGPFAAWDPGATYSAGQRVSYGGYIYEAMTAISAGDDPRTATYTATLTNKIGPGTDTMMARKWRLWDYPATYHMARLRGLTAFQLDRQAQVRTFCVRGEFNEVTEVYTYPDAASYSGYGMPAGLDTEWPDPTYGELMAAPSEVPFEEGDVPKAYPYQPSIGGDEAVCFQPNTVAAVIKNDLNAGSPEDYLLPAWSDETQGQMFACAGTFSREYGFRILGTGTDESSTPAFQDNWEATRAWTGYDGLDYIIYTEPDLRTDV